MAKPVASTELERLTPGQQYTRQELYELFNVPENKRRGNWNTGYHQYQGLWFIFATVSGPSRTGHDYENSWAEDEAFVWRGKTRSYKGQASIQSLIAPEATVLLFTREHDRDPFTFNGTVVPREVKDTVPVTVVWEIQGPERGDENRIGSTASDVPYLRNVASSEFYTKLRGTIESEMPLNELWLKTKRCSAR